VLPCVILAGGLGTRMRPLTETVPKALVPVLGRPFVDWQLELLVSRGLRRATFCVGYRGDMLREHVGDGSRHGLSVDWVNEGRRLRGTAGALRLALDRGALADAFFVLYGDSYLPIDLEAVEASWRGAAQPALMTVMANEDRWDASNAIYASGRVELYDKARPQERRSEMRWIDYGLSVLTADVIRGLPADRPSDLADLLRELSGAGSLAGLEVAERFYEAGSPGGVRELERYLAAGDGDRPDHSTVRRPASR